MATVKKAKLDSDNEDAQLAAEVAVTDLQEVQLQLEKVRFAQLMVHWIVSDFRISHLSLGKHSNLHCSCSGDAASRMASLLHPSGMAHISKSNG